MCSWGAMNTKKTDKNAQGLEYMVGLCDTLPKAGRGLRTVLGQGNVNILTQGGLGRKNYVPVVKGESLSLGDSHPESSLP